MYAKRFAYSGDFLEHLNYALGEPTARGLNTLVAIDPDPIDPVKLKAGFEGAMAEEEHFLKQKQQNPNHKRELHGWRYDLGNTPMPVNPSEWNRAYAIAESLDKKSLGKLIGGYGGKRGNAPTGELAVEMAADTLYNASYGIDVLTGAPLNYKHNAGHLLDFKNHGQGQTRPEQARVNKTLQEYDGMEKLLLAEKTLDDIATAKLYAKHPEAMTELLQSLPSSSRETQGWNPELNAMKANAERWNMI